MDFDDFTGHGKRKAVEKTPVAFVFLQGDDVMGHRQLLMMGADGLDEIRFALLRELLHRVQCDFGTPAETLCLRVFNRHGGKLRKTVNCFCNTLVQRFL